MIDTPKEAATGDKAARDLMLSELLQVCTQGSWLLDGLTVYALEHDGWNKGEEQFSNSFWASVQSGKNATGINHLNANAKLIALAPTIAAELIKERAVNAKLLEVYKQMIVDAVRSNYAALCFKESILLANAAIKQAEALNGI
jgi:hypothetical protein